MKGNKSKKGRIQNLLLNGVILLTIIMLFGSLWLTNFGISQSDTKTIFGYKPIKIVSDSMEPTIRKGAMILGVIVPFEDLEIGDIITYRLHDGNLNTHRIIAKEYDAVYTKGDNADVPDDISITEDIFVYKIDKILNWTTELNTWQGWALYIIAPFIGLFILLTLLISLIRSLFRRAAPEEDEPAKQAQSPVPMPPQPPYPSVPQAPRPPRPPAAPRPQPPAPPQNPLFQQGQGNWHPPARPASAAQTEEDADAIAEDIKRYL